MNGILFRVPKQKIQIDELMKWNEKLQQHCFRKRWITCRARNYGLPGCYIFWFCEHHKWNSILFHSISVEAEILRMIICKPTSGDNWENVFLIILVKRSWEKITFGLLLESYFYQMSLAMLHVRNVPTLPQTQGQTCCRQNLYEGKFLCKCHEYLIVIYRQEEEES